jgi:hypothetical protein
VHITSVLCCRTGCAVLPHRVCSLGLASAVHCCGQSARASALYLACGRRWCSRRLSARVSARYLMCLRRWCCFRLSARGYLVCRLYWCCCHLGARASARNLVCCGGSCTKACITSRAPNPRRSWSSRHLHCCPFWCPRGIPAARGGGGWSQVGSYAVTR